MKILVLVHSDLVPPIDKKISEEEKLKSMWETEYDVAKTLRDSGHRVKIVGVWEDLKKIRNAIEEFKPSIIYNLLEEFKGEAIFDQHVVSYLELLGTPYTGCNPKGLVLGRDKALSKKILSYHKIASPKFQVFPKNKPNMKNKLKEFPLIVKCLNEEASLGISKASVVNNDEKLKERVQFIHENFNTDAIVEQFIEGAEYFVGVMGNYQAEALPVWGLNFDEVDNPSKEFYSTKAKFNKNYRERKGISTSKAKISKKLELQMQKLAKRTYKVLGLNGYARIDLRIDKDQKIYILEVNPNPDISKSDDFAMSAKHAGIAYAPLLEKILSYGKKWSG